MKRLGERPDPSRTYFKRPGAYGIILRGTDALLTMSYEREPSPQLAGGGIDPGESPLRALHREVMEETGWRISVDRRLGCYQRFSYLPEYDQWAQKVCSIYLCRPVLQVRDASEPFHTAIWSPLDLLPELLIDPTQAEFVADYIHGL